MLQDSTGLSTEDKQPSRYETDSPTHPRYLHPSNQPGAAIAPASPDFPRTLHGRPPKDSTPETLAKGAVGPTIDVATEDEARAAVASGDYRPSPADWLPAAEDATEPEYPKTIYAKTGETRQVANAEIEADYLATGEWKAATWAVALLVLAFGLLSAPLFAQTTVTQTTLSSALSAPAQGAPNTVVALASATGVSVPSATAPGSELFVDGEAMIVQSLVAGTTTTYNVLRGYDATAAGAHASGALVYAGPAAGVFGTPFVITDPPIGNCTLSNETYSLRINTRNGNVWQCTGSTTAAVWLNVIDSYAWIGPGSCWYGITTGTVTAPTFGAVSSGTALGITTQISTGPAIPVIQVASTNAGVISTDTLTCQIPIPSRINASKGVYVVDATWAYGIIGTGGVNATQVAVEASGTMNGVLVFSTVAFPAAGAAETASTVAPVRWDAGTLTLTPAKAAFNSLVTTAGAFFTQKFTPATPMPMASDLTEYFVALPILCNTTQATAIYSSGVLVHYRQLTGY